MDNIAELYRTLGVEMPTDQTGEQEQEVAEPAETGEQEQELAEPAADTDGEETEPDEKDEPETEPKPNKKQLSREERAANAARRRQKEIDDAVNAALEKERSENNARWQKFFDQAQMKNRHADNAAIDSLEKAEAWAEQDRIAQLQANLKKGSLTPQDLQTAVEQSPAFRAMQQKLQAGEQAAAQQNQKQFEQSVEVELAQIQKLNPKIKSIADILAMDTGKQWASYVQNNNMSYLDAYRLANMDALIEQGQKAAAAGDQMRSKGKSHLQPVNPRGQGGVEVPKRVKELYRMGRPNMTDAEIEADYRKRTGKA